MEVPTPKKAEDILRGCLKKNNIQPVWDQSFASLSPLDSELESHNKDVENLRVKVRDLLFDSEKELTHNVQFINLLCHLGVSYHFEIEIEDQLSHIFSKLPQLLEDSHYDLCTLANLFRVLRQYGYNMASDVFKKFKDEDGEFNKDIANDVEGILSLYEACFLAVEGEDILDEALAFTKKNLNALAENSSPRLKTHIRNALLYPSHRTIERLDAFHFISFYMEDESANETLLKFAKLDYNRLQLHYRKDIAAISRWTIDAGNELAEYMKQFYWTVLEETEKINSHGCSCKASYVKEMIKELARCYIEEANWKIERIAPSFDEYLKIGKVTSTYDIFTSAIILGTESFGMKEIIWVRSDPKSSIGGKLVCRLLNDLAVKMDELDREDFPKALDCYTKQHGVSENEAFEAIKKLLECVWKGMNEDLVKPTNMPRIMVKYNFNFARISTLYYGGKDLYTYASNMKQLIMSMFLNSLPV